MIMGNRLETTEGGSGERVVGVEELPQRAIELKLVLGGLCLVDSDLGGIGVRDSSGHRGLESDERRLNRLGQVSRPWMHDLELRPQDGSLHFIGRPRAEVELVERKLEVR